MVLEDGPISIFPCAKLIVSAAQGGRMDVETRRIQRARHRRPRAPNLAEDPGRALATIAADLTGNSVIAG
jgi:hypothetical protein